MLSKEEETSAKLQGLFFGLLFGIVLFADAIFMWLGI